MIICENLPANFDILYNEAMVKVESKCDTDQMRFVVHLPEGEKEIYLIADHLKNESWHEAYKGETPMAETLGKLIERYNNSL
ncbi:hypothetical protein [Deminuibacter soli]|uniref:Uncharacterized protein n=1 Tax=Deminuibacter soli TaxID=2291815 RepID=A0A3E1NEW8_9BACT|nr:hypothetical protein [Deminuibacter soli]RFM26344.1 hypothetical protein DXN05_20770 [Deminuibacter soli]